MPSVPSDGSKSKESKSLVNQSVTVTEREDDPFNLKKSIPHKLHSREGSKTIELDIVDQDHLIMSPRDEGN